MIADHTETYDSVMLADSCAVGKVHERTWCTSKVPASYVVMV